MKRCTPVRTRLLVSVILAAGSVHAANQWFDTGAAAGVQGGIANWDTGVAAWSMTSGGTTVPVAWTNGNNAWFTAGNSTATVNGVSANILTFGNGTVALMPGTGPLTLTGPLTNASGTVNLYTPIALATNQTWWINGNQTVNAYGPITGACVLTLMHIPNGGLTLTNAGNQLAGLTVNGGTLNAYNGGNVLGGSSSALTLGSATGQVIAAQLTLAPSAAGTYTYTIGDLTAVGAGSVTFNHTGLAGVTNILSGGNLVRAGRGTLLLDMAAPYGGLDNARRVTFSGGTNTVNGMLGPWIVDRQNKRYLTIGANGLVNVTATVGQGGAWSSASNVVLTADTSLGVSTSVNSIVVDTRKLTVGSGLVLSNSSGGFLFDNGGALLGSGTVEAGSQELVVFAASGAAVITPAISGSGGLTVFGAGMLTLSNNLTYSGDTWINGSTLNLYVDGAKTWNGTINGVGTLAKAGPGTLVLDHTTNNLGGSLTASGGTLVLDGGLVNNWSPLAFGSGATLVISNACRVYANQGGASYTYVGGNSNTLRVVGSGLAGPATVLDANANNNRYMIIGNGGGKGNTVVVDGLGVAGGAVMTNIYQIAVGNGAASTGNRMSVTNGGRFFLSNTANYNGISVGGGGNNQSFWVGGGSVPSVVSNITYYGFTIGGQGGANAPGTNNVVTLGANAQVWSMVQFYGTNNALNINSGATWNGAGNNLLGGLSNSITVDGGLMNNVSGGLQDGGGGVPKWCTISVKNGGQLLWPNAAISFANTAGDSNNTILISSGGLWSRPSGNADFTLGAAGGLNNQMVINGGTVTNVGRFFYVQGAASGVTVTNGTFYNSSSSGTVIGNGSGSNDFLTIQGGGTVNLNGGALTVGNGIGTGNVASVQAGGLLDAGTLVVAAGAGNLITNSGGVYQFTTATPTITPSSAGQIALNNGTISFRAVTAANVKGNWSAALSNITFSGANAFRLNNSTNNNAASQSYWFDTDRGNTNYAGLEMFNGGTAYTNGSVTIGTNGWLTFSNTQATMWGPVTNYGVMSVFDSTVTFMSNLVLAEGSTLLWSTNNTTNAITVLGPLTLPSSLTVVVPSEPAKGTSPVLINAPGGISGSPNGWMVLPASYRVVKEGAALSLIRKSTGTLILVY